MSDRKVEKSWKVLDWKAYVRENLAPLRLGGEREIEIVEAALAGYLPARRAAKVDPMIALRYE